MKHPFPTRRTNTITRANIAAVRAEFPSMTNTADICATIYGKVLGKEERVKRKWARLVERCERLMLPRSRASA